MVAETPAPRHEAVAPADVRELVYRLGGPAAVGRDLGVTLEAVCMWYTRGVSPRFHAPLWRLAQAKGVPWTPPGFEGVRLLPVDTCHSGDASVNGAPSERESSVNLGDAA